MASTVFLSQQNQVDSTIGKQINISVSISLGLFFREQNPRDPLMCRWREAQLLSWAVGRCSQKSMQKTILGEEGFLPAKVETMGHRKWSSPWSSLVWDELFLQFAPLCKSTRLDGWTQNLSPRVNKNCPHYTERIIQLLCGHCFSYYYILSMVFRKENCEQ